MQKRVVINSVSLDIKCKQELLRNGGTMEQEVTITQLEEAAKKIADARKVTDTKRAELKQLDKEAEELEVAFMAMLEATEKSSYHSEVGTLTITNRESVKTPKTNEEKEALFNWLKEKGLYMEVVSVNSQTLQRLYKDEKAAAEERGELFFRLPGVGDPVVNQFLSFRKK